MPAYNAAPFLEGAALSVLAQTYSNLELIIVDDGSVDDTALIAERAQRDDPSRVRVIRQENAGVAAARNAALRIARGEFFALLDSDDLWEPGFLEHQMAMLTARPEIDLVVGNGRYLGGERHGTLVRSTQDPGPPLALPTIIADEQAVFIMTVFRRRVFETIGGYDEALRTNEDFDFWLRAALAGFRFERNLEPLAWYRRRSDSLSADGPRMLRGALRVCRKCRPLVAEGANRDLLDRQIAYYEAELDAALARQALASGDGTRVAAALAALHARRPSVRTAVAAATARWAAPLVASVYRLKQRIRVALRPATPLPMKGTEGSGQ